jgi:hypothetical protein
MARRRPDCREEAEQKKLDGGLTHARLLAAHRQAAGPGRSPLAAVHVEMRDHQQRKRCGGHTASNQARHDRPAHCVVRAIHDGAHRLGGRRIEQVGADGGRFDDRSSRNV